jgi:hypothetical protein
MGQSKQTSVNKSITTELDALAKTVGLEFVYGDKFPLDNPYGSYGSPCVFDIFINDSNNVLFLCRKPKELYKQNSNEDSRELVNFYDYALIFAIKNKGESKYKIRNVIKKEIGLKGMYLHYAEFNKDLSQFTSINNAQKRGPKGKSADYRSGTLPIFISSESAFVVLYYYRGEWFEYKEVDD